jgi:CheY-like chemotaxis protein
LTRKSIFKEDLNKSSKFSLFAKNSNKSNFNYLTISSCNPDNKNNYPKVKRESSNKLIKYFIKNIPKPDCINIIVADDEIFTRQSTIRIISNISKELNLNLNILEAEDGVETLYLIYKAPSLGAKISLIFSDENMNFMNGMKSCNIIKDIIDIKKLADIPFYLVSSVDGMIFDKKSSFNLTKVLEKPLERHEALTILKKFIT